MDEVPAAVIVLRTDRFALRASMYVDLYATLARGHGRDQAEATTLLVACETDACARGVLASDLQRSDFEALLPDARQRWVTDFGIARGAMERGLGWLATYENALVERIARDLAIAWPAEAIVLPVTAHAAAREDRAVFDAPTLDVEEGCVGGPAILACAFVHAVRVLAPQSEILRALAPQDARAKIIRVVRNAIADVVPSRSPSGLR